MVEFMLGKREITSYGKESTYGTAVTPTDVLGRETRWEPKNDQRFQEIRGAGSDSINIDKREKGPLDVGGTLRFAPQNWKWLQYPLGTVASVDQGAYYEHTITNAKAVSSFTLERAIQHTTDRVRTYAGCQVNNCTITWDAGGGAGGSLMEVALETIAKIPTNGTSTTALSTPTTAAFQFRNALLALMDTEVVELIGGSIVIDNKLHPARYANYSLNRYKGESVPTTRRFTGTFRINTKDDTWFDAWETATNLTGTQMLIFRRGTNDQLAATFTDLTVGTAPDPTNLDGINVTTLNWAAKDIAFVAQDQIASY